MKVKIGDTELCISFLFAAMLSVLTAFDKSYSTIVCFFSILFHELSHVLMLCVFGVKINRIILNPFGVLIDCEDELLGKKKKIAVSAAGIVFNFSACVIFVLLYRILKKQILLNSAFVNFLLGALNALPVKNLDGGDIVGMILTEKYGEACGRKRLSVLSVSVSLLLSIAGAAVFFTADFNPTLLILSANLLFFSVLKKTA